MTTTPATRAEAEAREDAIRRNTDDRLKLISAGIEANDWKALGYAGLAAWCRVVCSADRAAPEVRKRLAAALRAEGYSLRGIAAELDISKDTAARVLEQVSHPGTPAPATVTGRDGKHYPLKEIPPEIAGRSRGLKEIPPEIAGRSRGLKELAIPVDDKTLALQNDDANAAVLAAAREADDQIRAAANALAKLLRAWQPGSAGTYASADKALTDLAIAIRGSKLMHSRDFGEDEAAR